MAAWPGSSGSMPSNGSSMARSRPWLPPPPSNSALISATSTSSASSARPARSRASAARWPLRPCHRRHAKGRLFRLSRDELVECAALVDSVRRGELDCLAIPEQPLDVLAQQIVAEVASRECGRGRALCAYAAGMAVSKLIARGFCGDRCDAGGRLQHPARPTRCAHPS